MTFRLLNAGMCCVLLAALVATQWLVPGRQTAAVQCAMRECQCSHATSNVCCCQPAPAVEKQAQLAWQSVPCGSESAVWLFGAAKYEVCMNFAGVGEARLRFLETFPISDVAADVRVSEPAVPPPKSSIRA